MLKLTKKADYGLIALKHLAVKRSSASAKEIADTYHIPLPLLSKVLQTLGKTGFLIAEHGTNGGYRLSRDPGTMSALEVVRAIDGPVILTSCFTTQGDCDQSNHCNVKEPLRKIHEAILKLLENISIEDMARDDASSEGVPPVPGGRLLSPSQILPAIPNA